MKHKLELGNYIFDKLRNITGQIVVMDTMDIYVMFPEHKNLLTEYAKTDADIIYVGTERKYSVRKRLQKLFSKNKILK